MLAKPPSSPFQGQPNPSLASISSSHFPISKSQALSNNIKVVCRFRPQNKLEIQQGGKRAVLFDEDFTAVQVQSFSSSCQPGDDSKRPSSVPGTPSSSHTHGNIFRFDRLFEESADQEQVFKYTAESIVDDVMKGYNGTILAYGQTGAGKTYTMMGDVLDPKGKGITPRIIEKLFETIVLSSSDLEFTVKVSFMEIYMEKVKDLLQPLNDNLPVHEDKVKGVYVKGLLEVFVGSVQEVLEVMTKGQALRSVGSTTMNSESSRSHSIFQISITQKNTRTGSSKMSKLSLVDLAGSEKAGKTGATGQTMEEAKKINKSLSSLGNVINALTDGKSVHVPYRDSKLTRILQESLGGNARTSLIINCSPSSYNEAETLSTLRFGVRAKSIKNNAKINTELSPLELKTLLKQAKLQIFRLETQVNQMGKELRVWRTGGQVADSEWSSDYPEACTSAAAAEEPFASSFADEASIFNETPPESNLSLDTIQEYIQRETELQDTLAERESRISDLEEEIESLKSNGEKLKSQIDDALQHSKKVSHELSEMKLLLDKSKYEAKESALSMEGLREENAVLGSQIDSLKVELDSLRSNVNITLEGEKTPSNIAMETDKLRSELEQTQSHLLDSTTTISHLNTALENIKEENDCTARRLQTVQETLVQVQTEYQELLEQAFPSHDSSDTILKEQNELESKVREKVESQFILKMEQVNQEAAYLKDLLAHKETEISDLNEIIQDHVKMNDSLKTQVKKALERSKADLQSTGNALSKLNIAKYQENPHSQGESSRSAFLQSAFDQLGLVQSQLLIQNNQLKNEAVIMAKKLESRSERIGRIESQLSEALQQYSVLETRYKDDVAALEEKLKDVQAELASKSLSTPWIHSSKIAKPLRGGIASYGNQNDPSSTSSSPQKQHLSPTTIPGHGIGESLSSPRSLQGKRSSWYVSLLKK